MAEDTTALLLLAAKGDTRAVDRLLPVLYDDLHRVAHHLMRGEAPGQTLQTTALLNEAYLRLIDQRRVDWKGRTHFLAIAALSMRQILVQRARARHAAKRGGKEAARITLDDRIAAEPPRDESGGVDVLALDAALERLAALDAQQAKIVELRYFGGLTVEEVGEALAISPATVKRHWTLARAWLRKELAAGS